MPVSGQPKSSDPQGARKNFAKTNPIFGVKFALIRITATPWNPLLPSFLLRDRVWF
jgi:hypothetical protein